MRDAKTTLVLAIAALAVGSCHKQQQPQDPNIAIDEGVPDNQVTAGNVQFETLPADESSTTPSNQLQNGFDNPDVNDIGTSNAQ
jgi:hypothetical protein